MGMDLIPQNPSDDAPTDEWGVTPGRYNWAGWHYITTKLEEWGVPLDEFANSNNGDIISEATCKLVADAIEQHLPELPEEDRTWLTPHVALWRTCGGYAQF